MHGGRRTRRGEDASPPSRGALGIAAAQQGLIKAREWVRALSLTKGLLHGADVDGEAIEINGCFYKIRFCLWQRESAQGHRRRTPPGVLFYPLVGDEDDASKQYLLPLELFSRPSLTGKDSRALRAHAVRAGPDVARFEFGRDGASPGALAELDAVLESFELVKLKTGAGKKKQLEHWRRSTSRHFDRLAGRATSRRSWGIPRYCTAGGPAPSSWIWRRCGGIPGWICWRKSSNV